MSQRWKIAMRLRSCSATRSGHPGPLPAALTNCVRMQMSQSHVCVNSVSKVEILSGDAPGAVARVASVAVQACAVGDAPGRQAGARA